jgi:hypothetical protein
MAATRSPSFRTRTCPAVIFDKVEEFYKRYYFRPRKIAQIVGEMVRDWDMMKRRLREGVEFFDFLRSARKPHKPMSIRRLVVTADDFGAAIAVNEAVERAHVDGILTAASLMVAGEAPPTRWSVRSVCPTSAWGCMWCWSMAVPMLPPEQIPALVGPDGWFQPDMVKTAFAIAFNPAARAQMRAEVAAQFAAFAATGLPLDHVNAHKHFHMHPMITSVDSGRIAGHPRDARAGRAWLLRFRPRRHALVGRASGAALAKAGYGGERPGHGSDPDRRLHARGHGRGAGRPARWPDRALHPSRHAGCLAGRRRAIAIATSWPR